MSSISFDRAATYYDETRGYPPAVAQEIAQAIEQAAGEAQKFLEIGIGTGRIALPLASLGHDYSGVDISEKMVERLEQKLHDADWQEQMLSWGSRDDELASYSPPVRRYRRIAEPEASMRLVIADSLRLPFSAASFDAVVAVHIFHLISNWQQGIQEALRVLRSAGLLLRCWDEPGDTEIDEIAQKWQSILLESGGERLIRSRTLNDEIDEYLRQLNVVTEQFTAHTWQSQITVSALVQGITQRHWSSSWSIPEELFNAALQRFLPWVEQNFGEQMETPYTREHRFVISRTHARAR